MFEDGSTRDPSAEMIASLLDDISLPADCEPSEPSAQCQTTSLIISNIIGLPNDQASLYRQDLIRDPYQTKTSSEWKAISQISWGEKISHKKSLDQTLCFDKNGHSEATLASAYQYSALQELKADSLNLIDKLTQKLKHNQEQISLAKHITDYLQALKTNKQSLHAIIQLLKFASENTQIKKAIPEVQQVISYLEEFQTINTNCSQQISTENQNLIDQGHLLVIQSLENPHGISAEIARYLEHWSQILQAKKHSLHLLLPAKQAIGPWAIAIALQHQGLPIQTHLISNSSLDLNTSISYYNQEAISKTPKQASLNNPEQSYQEILISFLDQLGQTENIFDPTTGQISTYRSVNWQQLKSANLVTVHRSVADYLSTQNISRRHIRTIETIL